MAVTVYLRGGAPVEVEQATKVAEGYFIPKPGLGARAETAAAAVELQDDRGNVVGSFLHGEVIGYVIHGGRRAARSLPAVLARWGVGPMSE